MRCEIYYKNSVKLIITEIQIQDTHQDNHIKKIRALWDTGSVVTCLIEGAASKFNLISNEKEDIPSPDVKNPADIFNINILIPGFSMIQSRTYEINRPSELFDMIIGIDLISRGNFQIIKNNDKFTATFSPAL